MSLLESRVWTDERAALTTVMADSRLVTWLVRDVLSASEQVTEPTLVISAASLVKSLLGALVDFSRTMETQLLRSVHFCKVFSLTSFNFCDDL